MVLKNLFIIGVVLLAACSGNSAQGVTDYALAVQFLQGNGVPKDEQKGMSYLARAAAAKNPNAELAMGYYHLKGTAGVPQDIAKAVAYFTKAAEQGNRDAQYNLGLAHVRGQGVTKDLVKAYDWFEKAAYQDDAGAQYNAGVMTINGEGRVADPVAAYIWFRLAEEKGYGGSKEGMEAAKKDMTAEQFQEIDREYAKVSRKIQKPMQTSAAANQPL